MCIRDRDNPKFSSEMARDIINANRETALDGIETVFRTIPPAVILESSLSCFTTVPVSYTQLDVYKRQKYCSTLPRVCFAFFGF